MNTRNIFKLGSLLLVLLMALTSMSVAQQKWYVNVQTGLDGNTGLAPSGTAPVGPKATIGNAITAASAGDTIIVDYGNGNLYNENVSVTKKLIFGTSNNSGTGTPQIVSLTINNANAAPNNTVTFVGPFKINNGLTLTQGATLGAGNLTVLASVSRTAQSNTASATVDAQLNYSGVVNFTYVTAGFTMTTGFELPAAANTTNFGNLTTTGAGVLTLNEGKTMSGIITNAGGINLGGTTLNINNAAVAHAIGANITNGTLAFTITGAVAVNGNFNLPNVTATSAAAQTLTLATNTSIGDITAGGVTSVAVSAAGGAGQTVGNVINNGTGTVTLTGALNIASLSNTSSGVVTLTAAGAVIVTGNVSQSGSGSILFNSTTSNSIGGNVTNNPSLAITNAIINAGSNKGVIRFVGDYPATISGNLTVNPVITGAANSATVWNNAGEVTFGAAASLVTITGTLTVNATHTLTYGGTSGTATISNNGDVIFASAAGNIIISGGIANTTTWLNVTSITSANNGDVNMAARVAGTLGTGGSRTGAISNTSTISSTGNNGNIITGTTVTTTGGFFGTTVSTSGAAGGSIYFPDASFNVSSFVRNSRSVTGTHIQVGTAATATVAVSIGGNLENAGASTISFAGFNGAVAEAFSVTGQVISTGTGTIFVGGAQTGTGTFSFGSINITGGTVNLAGTGASVMNVVVNGTTTFAGGTWNMGTSAARTMQLGGLLNNFSSATTRTDFSSTNMANVALLIQPTSVIAAQTMTGNSTAAIWFGPITVNNTSGLQPAITFSGGNFRVLNTVTFTAGQIKLDNVTLFIGGQLAPAIGAGGLVNTAGYVTGGNGFLSMNGNGAQAVSGAGSFGNFEVDATTQTVTVAASTGDFTGNFNLTAGTVAGGANIILNNATTPPTIVVNAGTFSAGPTFTSTVNVYYIGIDKTVGNELPAATTKLNNLTVATTNGGATSGKGTVNVNVATTINGTLNVFPGQALLINGVNVTMKGAAITLDGDIANIGGGKLVLGATTGTTITGTGVLPDIDVANASANNVISGSVGLATGLLGADNIRSVGDDINPGATGGITFVGTTTASSLTVMFGGANASTGTHLATVTTNANAKGTLTLGANLIQAGNLTHNSGTIDVATFTYTLKGTAHTLDGTAFVTGTGSLTFQMVGATSLTAATQAATIAANVTVTTSPASTPYTLSVAGQNISITGGLTLAGASTVDVANGITLTAAGSSLTFTTTAASAVTAAGGSGILKLSAATPPLTFTYSGTPSIANLTISNDVVLAGTGTALTVGTAFIHDGGNLNFAAVNLTANGTYTRSGAAAYTATTGYFIVGAAATVFNQGSTAVSIPNLRLANGANLAATGTGVVTVTGTLDVQVVNTFTFTHTVSGAPKLAVADGATVSYGTTGAANGDLDVTPTYGATIKFTSKVNGNISTILWPSSPATLVTTFTVNPGANTSTLTSSRQVNGTLTLTSGTLALGTKTVTLTEGATINANGGAVTVGTGSVVYPSTNNVNVVYAGTTPTGPELGATVNNLTFTRTADGANFNTNIDQPVTVNGTLTIQNNITTLIGPPDGVITVNGNVVVALDAAFPSATAPVTTFNAAMIFGGTTDQTVTVPSTGATVGSITINKSTGNVILAGGNLTIGTGTAAAGAPAQLNLVSGLFMTGSNTLILSNQFNNTTQGWTRTVASGGKSHVVGNLRVPLKLGQIIPFGQNGFPVGDASFYRPAALTFVNTGLANGISLGVTATVKYDGTRPTGIVGLPIANGVSAGVPIARYPGFSWAISTSGSLGAQPFNLELTAEGYTDFDDVTNVRLIRRNGALTDITNQWLLQGAQYDNYVIGGVPTVVNVNSVGGLIQGGAIYTYGLKSTMTIANPIANVNLTDASTTFTRNLTNPALFTGAQGAITYSVSVANPAVATVAIASNVLTVTRKVSGATSVTVTGTDAFDGSRIDHTFQLSVVSDVEPSPGVVPTEFTLSQNYPNPFNPSTTIRFALPKEAPVTLEIYNILGMRIRTLISGQSMNAAFHSVVWDGKDDAGVGVSSGLYLYRIHAGQFQASKKMTLLK